VELGIGQTALRRWVDKAEVEAGRGPEGDLKRAARRSAGRNETGRTTDAEEPRNSKKSERPSSPGRAREIRFYRSGEGAMLSVALMMRVLKVSRSGYTAGASAGRSTHN